MGDYDRKPMEPPSQFLRLKSKGESVRIRIASSPFRELKVWPAVGNEPPLKSEVLADLSSGQWMRLMSNPDYNVSEVYHFIVIDKADGAAKIFTTTGGVYGKVRDYATNTEWGDPKGYDLTITRTENPGKNYYEVVPSPNKSDLLTSDLLKVEAIDIRAKVASALPASDPQPDDFDSNVTQEMLPWEQGTPSFQTTEPAAVSNTPAPEPSKPIVPDVIIEDIGDEPINLDDIPF